ncbi:cobalamin biosynthesis protein CbiG [Thiocapsa imhoffii]|uniref:Cobalamin biosynthesis protein CbiG n=1 Tax=Thiocapsa imhoffii TaxID=382777 RepID=A0A9X0WJR0_9GAMM|nr:cobalamin biosynthesis protein CbiG [Thiocapsa imhoffii]
MIAVVLGVGCDRGTPLTTLEAALELPVVTALGPVHIHCIASIDRKSDEPAILALAAAREVPLRFYPAAVLARVRVPSPSLQVRRLVGTPSVCEAAALLAGGARSLIVPKQVLRGPDGKHVTIALAPWVGSARDECTNAKTLDTGVS